MAGSLDAALSLNLDIFLSPRAIKSEDIGSL